MSHSDIQDYKFMHFSKNVTSDEDVKAFQLPDISEKISPSIKEQDIIVLKEKLLAKEEEFKISPIVREHRGYNDQENREKENRIQDEVERRITLLHEEAYQKGYEDGLESGKQEVFEQTRLETEQKLESLTELINEVLNAKEEILSIEKMEVYKLIRTLTKWVTLKELDDDGEYIRRLLEKLIVEMQTKTNLLVQVNESDFDQMPDVLNYLQKKLGELKNVRVEIDQDVKTRGIILESENGIINGTMEEQFRSFDKLFESIGLETSEGVDE
jgi:flagellar assembly protein FliH